MKKILTYLAVFLVITILPIPAIGQSLTWHADQLILSTSYDAGSPSVAISGSNAVAVWKQSTSGHDRIYASYSTDKGASWFTPPVIIDAGSLTAQSPQVAIDGSNVVVVFIQWDGSRYRIYSNHSADGGATWGGAQLIEDNTGNNGYDPQVVISGSNVVAVWRQSDGTRDRIYANHSIDGGATWGTDGIIDSRAYAATSPYLAISGSNVVAIWSQNDGDKTRIFSRYSNDAGVTWAGTDQSVENIDMNQYSPLIAISGNNVVAVWVLWDSIDNVGRIYANRAAFSSGVLTWTPGNAQRIEDNDLLDQDAPKIAISGDKVVAVWNGYDDSTSAYRVYVAASADAGASWGADALLQTADVDAGSPQVVISGNNVMTVWGQGESDYYIYARHSFDGGSSWSTPGLIQDNTGLSVSSSRVAISGSDVVAVWLQMNGDHYAVYADYATFGEGGFMLAGSGGGCFIATVAFGSPLAAQVEILRQFRDKYLLTNAWGKKFVAWYYENGPAAASFIQDKPLLKAAVRASLYPLIGFSFLLINGYLTLLMAGLLLTVLLFFRFRPNKVSAE